MIRLTQLDGTPVFIQMRAIVAVRAPLPGEFEDAARCVVEVAGKNHAVKESVEWVMQKLGGTAV